MKIWCYHGKQPWAIPIEIGTGGPDAHTELEFEGLGSPFFSSTLATGPRFTTFDKLTSRNMDDWRVIDLGDTGPDAALAQKAARMILHQAMVYGRPPTYNEEGIALNFLPQPLIRQNPSQYFCSQVVVTALQTIGLFQNMVAAMMSPNDVADWLDRHLAAWQALRFKVNEES